MDIPTLYKLVSYCYTTHKLVHPPVDGKVIYHATKPSQPVLTYKLVPTNLPATEKLANSSMTRYKWDGWCILKSDGKRTYSPNMTITEYKHDTGTLAITKRTEGN